MAAAAAAAVATPASATVTTAAISSTSLQTTTTTDNNNNSSSSSSTTDDHDGMVGFQRVTYFHRKQIRKILDSSSSDEMARADVFELLHNKYSRAEIECMFEHYMANKALDYDDIELMLTMRKLQMPFEIVARRLGRNMSLVGKTMRLYKQSQQRHWSAAESAKLLVTVASTSQTTTTAFWTSITTQMKLGKHRFKPRDALTTKQHYEALMQQQHQQQQDEDEEEKKSRLDDEDQE